MGTIKQKTFYISESEQKKYSEIQSYMKKFKGKNGKFIDKKMELNIDSNDSDLYLAYNFVEACSTMRAHENCTMGDKLDNMGLAETLRSYKEGIFSRTGYLERTIKANNDYYSRISENRLLEDYNPWHINNKGKASNVMEEEFTTQLQYNSRIELIAKNMIWCNRATKEVETVRKNVVMEKAGSFKKVQEYSNKYESVADEILNDETLYDGENLATEFLDRYSAYLSGDFELDEIKEDESYKKIESILAKNGGDLTVEDVFKYTSLSMTGSTLYTMKNMYMQMAVKEIDELKKKRKLGGIKMAKSKDESSKSGKYNYRFQISIPGYNSPFTVHACNDVLVDMVADKSVKFEEKDLKSPCFSACVYKFNNQQRTKINELSRRPITSETLSNLVDYSFSSCRAVSFER